METLSWTETLREYAVRPEDCWAFCTATELIVTYARLSLIPCHPSLTSFSTISHHSSPCFQPYLTLLLATPHFTIPHCTPHHLQPSFHYAVLYAPPSLTLLLASPHFTIPHCTPHHLSPCFLPLLISLYLTVHPTISHLAIIPAIPYLLAF